MLYNNYSENSLDLLKNLFGYLNVILYIDIVFVICVSANTWATCYQLA